MLQNGTGVNKRFCRESLKKLLATVDNASRNLIKIHRHVEPVFLSVILKWKVSSQGHLALFLAVMEDSDVNKQVRRRGGGIVCCVPGCHNNSVQTKEELSFYVIPKNKLLRKKWLHNISRKNFKPTSSTRVCSEHFEGGAKTYLNNVPTIFPLKKSHPTKTPKPRRIIIKHLDVDNDILNKEDEHDIVEELRDEEDTKSEKTCIDDLKQNILLLENNIVELKILAERRKFGIQRFLDSDSDMLYYTGFENSQHFKALYTFLDGGKGACSRLNYWGSNNSNVQLLDTDKRGKKRSLDLMDELFLTLCRLRLNLPEKVLADHYEISVSEVSRIFVTWLDFMFTRFIQLPIWASRKTVDSTMPDCFKCEYSSTRVILDCTEIFIERPSCFRVQSETYSTYKSHNTAKGLVGIAPNGAVTFVSDLYGGHVSDKEIVKLSDFLNLIEPEDSVMADRGFEIQDLLVSKKCSLNIPVFMRCKDQLNPDEEEETRHIASVRIHVERAIGRVKTFNILKQVVPNSISQDLNKIWIVCAILTNFKGPLVS